MERLGRRPYHFPASIVTLNCNINPGWEGDTVAFMHIHLNYAIEVIDSDPVVEGTNPMIQSVSRCAAYPQMFGVWGNQ